MATIVSGLEVFDRDITPLGSIDTFEAFRWTERYDSCGSFELWCPATPENTDVLKINNLLWIGGSSAGVIEVLERRVTERNEQEIHIKGRMIESYLSDKILWDTYTASNQYVSDIIRGMVNVNCINPTDKDRIIPLLKLKEGQAQFGERISYQRTGTEVMEATSQMCSAYGLGFAINLNPIARSLEFEVLQGVDRTIRQSTVVPVVFSSDTEDILASTYYRNVTENKTIALVAGAGEGAARKKIVVGSGVGLDRKELYIDARDLQETNDQGVPISESAYLAMLLNRGVTYLAEKKDVESFDAIIKSFGDQQYVYERDYRKGDLVTVQDGILNLTVNARITEVERIYDKYGYKLNLVFGYAQPTLSQKLKFLGLGV